MAAKSSATEEPQPETLAEAMEGTRLVMNSVWRYLLEINGPGNLTSSEFADQFGVNEFAGLNAEYERITGEKLSTDFGVTF